MLGKAVKHKMLYIPSCRLHHDHLIVVKIDTRKACDSLTQSAVAVVLQAAVRRGSSPIVALAIFVEISDRGACAHFPGGSSTFFKMEKGCGQGPSETPALITAVLDYLLAGAVNQWQERGWGF